MQKSAREEEFHFFDDLHPLHTKALRNALPHWGLTVYKCTYEAAARAPESVKL
jgi:hypothetical protein